MPKNVVYESLTEAQDYADRVNGQPVEVEGGYTVMNPLGYADGGKYSRKGENLGVVTVDLMMKNLAPTVKSQTKKNKNQNKKNKN
jgi:hypothetical protein